MNAPDFVHIGHKLKNSDDIPISVEPFAAYLLVPLLQLALRHPALKVEHPSSHEQGTRIARLLQERLREIDPAIAESLDAGWDESLDMSSAEYAQFEKTDDLPQRNYSQLRPDIQEEVIANSVALGLACDLLAAHLGGTQSQWANQIIPMANDIVDQMSEQHIKQEIARIDFQRDFQYPPPA